MVAFSPEHVHQFFWQRQDDSFLILWSLVGFQVYLMPDEVNLVPTNLLRALFGRVASYARMRNPMEQPLIKVSPNHPARVGTDLVRKALVPFVPEHGSDEGTAPAHNNPATAGTRSSGPEPDAEKQANNPDHRQEPGESGSPAGRDRTPDPHGLISNTRPWSKAWFPSEVVP